MTRRDYVAWISPAVSRGAAAVTVAIILALAGGALAVPNQDNCLDLISGRLSAAPSVIDRGSASVVTTLRWSVSVPANCPVSLRLSLAGRSFHDRSGDLILEVTKTTTFQLQILLLPGARVLAATTVTVLADPGFITVSPGRAVTTDDLAKFYAQWMQPFQQSRAEGQAEWWLKTRFDAGAWETNERMTAIARMYELTHDPRYLTHLRTLIEHAYNFRDDHHMGFHATNQDTGEVFDFPAQPLDEIRGRQGLPAWGGKSLNSGGLHRVDEVVSSLYAHPMATFARIVAEDPDLNVTSYGDDAMRYANAALQTVWLFMSQIRYRTVGNFVEAWLTLPLEYRNRPLESECDDAYNDAVESDPANQSRWEQMRGNCKSLHLGAGSPIAHNENLAFAMVLIELWRVLDSPFYRQSPMASPDAVPTRALIPLLVSRQQRFFVNRLHPWNTSVPKCGWITSLCWNYSDDLPAGIKYHVEDTSHGALDMRYVDLLRRDFNRLNPLPASVGEPIPLGSEHLAGFADTFLQRIAAGTHFNEDVVGHTADPVDLRNGNCDGWMNLAIADVNVYHRCHEISLRIVNGAQPYLNIGNHSALLMNKRFLADAPPPPPPAPPPPPPPRMCPIGRKCCESGDDGGCTLCIPGKAQCP